MTATTPAPVEVTQADRDALERIDDALGFLMEDEREIVLQSFARHRTLTPAQAAGPVLLEATIEQVAELQLAAFLAGRGSVVTKDRGSTIFTRPAPTMDDFRRMARAAITQAEGPQANADG